MNKYFAVDRSATLHQGLVIDLVRHRDITPDFLQSHIDELYPEGLSKHGQKYLLDPESKTDIASPIIELLFENIRRAHFPNLPSRFQSFFACNALDDARQFRQTFGNPDSPIWEIHSDSPFVKANMRLLDNQQTNLVCSYLAHEYWRGSLGPKEIARYPEVVIKLPVTIGKRVE